MAERVEIDIIARTENATKGLQSFIQQLTGLSLGVAGAVRVTKELIRFGQDCAREYLEQQRAVISLTNAFRVQGQYSASTIKGLEDLAKGLQKTTVFADDVTLSAMAMVKQLTTLDSQALQSLIPHIQDFASGMGMDLVSAATLVAKTIGSDSSALGRYGIEINAAKSESEKLAEVIDQLDAKFGNLATTIGESTVGQIERLKNNVAEFKAEIGKPVVEELAKNLSWYWESWKDLISDIKNGTFGGSSQSLIRFLSESGNINTPPSLGGMTTARNPYSGYAPYKPGAYGGAINLGGPEQAAPFFPMSDIWQREKLGMGVYQKPGEAISQVGGLDIGFPGAQEYDFEMFLDKIQEDVRVAKILHNRIQEIAASTVLTGTAERAGIPPYLTANMALDLGGPIPDPKLIAERDAELKDLKATYEDVFRVAADAMQTMGQAFASGDIVGGLAAIGQQLTSMITEYCIGAAATYAMAGNWASAAGWLALAGISAFGGGIMSGAGSGADAIPAGAGIPSYDTGGEVGRTGLAIVHKGERVLTPGQAGGVTNINHYHIAGSIWQTEDLARAVARAQSRWS